MKDTVTQVLLGLGGERQTAWIETRGAQKGKLVEIKEDGRFWQVLEVYSTMDAKTIKDRERDFKNHRSATDI